MICMFYRLGECVAEVGVAAEGDGAVDLVEVQRVRPQPDCPKCVPNPYRNKASEVFVPKLFPSGVVVRIRAVFTEHIPLRPY